MDQDKTSWAPTMPVAEAEGHLGLRIALPSGQMKQPNGQGGGAHTAISISTAEPGLPAILAFQQLGEGELQRGIPEITLHPGRGTGAESSYHLSPPSLALDQRISTSSDRCGFL